MSLSAKTLSRTLPLDPPRSHPPGPPPHGLTPRTHLSLEAAVEADHEWVVCECEDVPLGEHLLDLVPQHQVVFEELLESEPLPGLLVSHQVHGPTERQTA